MDAVLLARSATGVDLTEDGRRVFTVGLEMLEYAQTLGRLPTGRRRGLSGKITLGLTEGVGTFWVVPRLVEFFEEHPRIQIDLKTEMRVPDISRLEVDVAIQLDRPRDPNMIVTRLGYLHLGLFAAREYLARFGVPESMEDVAEGRFVHQVADQIPSELLKTYVNPIIPDEFINLKCNTSTAHAFAVARGAGVGVLPTYAVAISRRLVPIMSQMTMCRDIWLVCHPDAAKFKRVQALVKWLKRAFDPKRHPWFGKTYIPAEKLIPLIAEQELSLLFDGMTDPGVAEPEGAGEAKPSSTGDLSGDLSIARVARGGN